MDCDWTVETVDGVTLVSVLLTNETPTDRRIRLANRLDGPVLPPRCHGVAEAGWEDGGYETVVPAGERTAVGYACPAPADDPPVELVVDERASDTTGDIEETSAVAVVRRLGTPEPPRDAVPTPERVDGEDPERATGDIANATLDSDAPDTAGTADEPDTGRNDARDEILTDEIPTDETPRDKTPATDLPASVTEWLGTVEIRVDRAERLTDPSVATATAALTEAGGLDAVADLPETVAADADQLRAVAARAQALAERAEETDVSLAPLRRLA